jgi:hypothetical protein
MLPTRSLFCVALTLMSIAGSARASAQTSDAQSAAAQMDLFDVWRRIRHTPAPAAAEPSDGTKRMIVVTPVIGSNPSAGFTFGVAGQLAVVRGDPRTTRISAGIASLTFSTKKQAMLNMRFALFTNENRWLVEGDNRFHSTSQNIYGLGTATPASSAVGADYGFVRLHETVYRRVTRGVWAGGGVLFDSHSSVGPAEGVEEEWPTSPYVTYSQSHDLPLGGQQSAGVSANVLINTRDSDIEPRRGWYANAAYQMFGGDSTWQLLSWRAAPIRRSRVPRNDYGQRIARYGGLRERDDAHQPAGRRSAVRFGRAGRWRRSAGTLQQALEDPTLLRRRMGRTGSHGVYLAIQEAF